MYLNSGYKNNSLLDFKDKSKPLIVGSCGTSLEYERIFKRIILELQRCQFDYEEMLNILLRYVLILVHRELTKERKIKNENLDHEMEIAAQYFNDYYNNDISIEEYAWILCLRGCV